MQRGCQMHSTGEGSRKVAHRDLVLRSPQHARHGTQHAARSVVLVCHLGSEAFKRADWASSQVAGTQADQHHGIVFSVRNRCRGARHTQVRGRHGRAVRSA